MMATLWAASGDRSSELQNFMAATTALRCCYPEDKCYIHPKSRHINKGCLIQHPELREAKYNEKFLVKV